MMCFRTLMWSHLCWWHSLLKHSDIHTQYSLLNTHATHWDANHVCRWWWSRSLNYAQTCAQNFVESSQVLKCCHIEKWLTGYMGDTRKDKQKDRETDRQTDWGTQLLSSAANWQQLSRDYFWGSLLQWIAHLMAFYWWGHLVLWVGARDGSVWHDKHETYYEWNLNTFYIFASEEK